MEKKITLFHGSEKVTEQLSRAMRFGRLGEQVVTQVTVCLFQSEI